MKQEFPLGGYDKDYDSKLSRAQAINCYLEYNADGSFSRVRRASGLTEHYIVGEGPIRGQFEIQNELFVVSRSKLYKIDTSDNITELGDVGGDTSKVRMAANGADDNQIMIVSDGNGYIYDPALGTPFQQITDPNFSVGDGLASLNQIFWVPKPDSNSFIGSDTANGLSWDSLRIASAEQNPDYVFQPVSLKGAIWWMGARVCEYWTLDAGDTDVPIRPVVGSTIPRGVGASNSIASFQDNIFWLADDFTVWQISGNQGRKISDLNLEYSIAGHGRTVGYNNPETAEGFFIDHPVHKMYVLTFPNDSATWVYDLTTGLWHKRQSKNLGRWRGNNSSLFNSNVLIGDFQSNVIWKLDEGAFSEGDDTLEYQLVPPAITSSTNDIYISSIELLMEVGVGSITNVDDFDILKASPITPHMTPEYSVNGGITWLNFDETQVSLGITGDTNLKVIIRKAIRIRRNFSLMLRFTVTDAVPVDMYRLIIDIEGGM